MTRNEAERAGWEFSFRPIGKDYCDCTARNRKTLLRVDSPAESCAPVALDAVLPAIEAIERYPEVMAENARLRTALAPFADVMKEINRQEITKHVRPRFSVAEIRAAAEAMEANPS